VRSVQKYETAVGRVTADVWSAENDDVTAAGRIGPIRRNATDRGLDVDSNHVTAAATLVDVLPLDILAAEFVFQCGKEVLRRMAVVLVGHQIDVVPIGGVFDGIERLSNDEFTVLTVFRLFEVGGPRVVVDVIRDRFGIVVVVVIVGCT
jgi:hypothetical protein